MHEGSKERENFFFFQFLLLLNNIRHAKVIKSNIISNMMAKKLLTVLLNWIFLITNEDKYFFLFVYWPVDTVTGFWFSVVNNQEYQLPQAREGGAKVAACTLLQVILSSLQASVNRVGMGASLWEHCISGDLTRKSAGKLLDWRWEADGEKFQHLSEREIWASKQPCVTWKLKPEKSLHMFVGLSKTLKRIVGLEGRMWPRIKRQAQPGGN